MESKKPRQTLAQQAYQQVRNNILRGDLRFGTPLSRRALASKLGMSVIPVTEAIQRLEMDGLVESWPRVGTRVKVPTAQDIRDSVILREALEAQAARLFAARANEAERQELVRMGIDLDLFFSRSLQSKGKDNSFEYHRRHMEFHMRIAECGGCCALQQALEKNQVLVLHWLYDTTLGKGSPQPDTWHEDLARTLSERDVVNADGAMRLHVQLGLDDFLRAVEPYSRMRAYPLRSPYAKTRERGRKQKGEHRSGLRVEPRSSTRSAGRKR
jgi:GntR family transcriptional regulator, rspAB operon transcriptional repressor